MKKIYLLLTAALLFTGIVWATAYFQNFPPSMILLLVAALSTVPAIYFLLTLPKKNKALAFIAALLIGLTTTSITNAQTVQTFNTTTTWTCPIGVSTIQVECWGGGGSGGGATGNTKSGGGGGAGGAYVRTTNISVSPGTVYTVTVGTGGAGTTGAGATGGSSWFASAGTILAVGGAGGTVENTNNASSAGATASSAGSIGTVIFKGGNGGTGASGNTAGGGGGSGGSAANGNAGVATTGGTAVTGGGAGGAGGLTSSNGGDGNDGVVPGGGGGGGRSGSSTDRNGGDGANGQVTLTYTPLTYKSQFISMDLTNGGLLPASWCAGETRNVKVTVKNTGTATWTDASPDINIGVKWNTNGTSWADYFVRVDAGGLAPGATATYTLPVTASNNAGAGYTTVLAAGTNNLTFDVVYEGVAWFASNAGGVGPGNLVSTSSAITINAVATAAAGTAVSTCSAAGAVNITAGASATNYSLLTWSSSGTGTFGSQNSLTAATYTPSAADISAGSVTITLTATGNGSCSPAASSKTLTITTSPTAVVGAALASICQGGTSAALGGSVTGSATGGTWSTPAGGAFSPSATNLNATWTPPAGYSGTATLTLTTSGGGCGTNANSKTEVVTPSPTANAGTALTAICQGGTSTALGGSVGGSATGGTWTDGGVGGTFNPDANTLNATWTPPSTYSGTATLTLTSSGGGCGTASAFKQEVVSGTPTIANAGSDQMDAATCGLTTVTLAGNTPTTGTGTWSIISGTGGSFALASNPTTNFAGVAGQTYSLQWTISSGPCTVSSDNVIITFNQNPTTSNAGPDQTGTSTCGLTTVTLAANNPSVGIGAWSIVSGTGGSFGDASSRTSTFSGVAGSAYTLQWTITNNPCGQSSSTVNVTFNIAPTSASAGPDQTDNSTCGLTSVTLAANIPVIGTGAWSIVSGSGGSFVDNTDPATTFSGVAGGSYVLRWTITNGICTSSDDVNITFNLGATIANAGTDQTDATTCGLTTVTLAANTPSFGTGTWSVVSGTGGSFGNIHSPSSIFSGIAGNAYNLQWAISSPCNTTLDSVLVTFNQNPTIANAGLDQAPCGATSVTLAGNTPLVGTGKWTIVSGTGGSFVDDTSPTTTFNGVAGSVYVLRWTISNAPCTSSSDDVQITFNQNSTAADAGPDQIDASTCGLTTVTLAANTPLIGTGAWSIVSGTGGSFGSASSPTSTFSGTAGTTYVLQWKISTTFCSFSTDNVTIKFNQLPSVTTATTKTICDGSSTNITLNASLSSTFAWAVGTIVNGITGANPAPAGSTGPINDVLSNPGNINAGSVQYVVTPTSTIGCTGSAATITVTVNPTPSVTNLATATTCSGFTNGVNISLTASTVATTSFTWTVSNNIGSITGASGGSTSTITQTLTNPSNSNAGSVQYNVIPTAASCAGASFPIVVTVNPKPSLSNASTAATCNGTSPNITLTASTTGTSTYSWTVSNIGSGISGGSANSGATINQTLSNTSNTTAGTLQYNVTPTSSLGCVGAASAIVVTVNPTPLLTTATTKTICSGTSPNISLTTGTSGTSTFAWTVGTIVNGITGANSAPTGSSGPVNDVLTNPSNSASGSVQYGVTPTSAAGCTGSSTNITVTVNPTPAVTNLSTATTCSGVTNGVNIGLTASTGVSTSFVWTVSNNIGSITGASGGSTSTITQTLANPSNSNAGSVQYNVVPTAASCAGASFPIVVTVNPKPSLSNASTAATCNGTSPNITLTASTTGTSTYSWTVSNIGSGISGGSANSGATINQTLSNTSNTASGTLQYNITPTSSLGCVGAASAIVVTVNPTPLLTTATTKTTCSSTSPNIALTTGTSGTSTFAWTVGTIIGGITGATVGTAGSLGPINDVLGNPSNSASGSVVYNVIPKSAAGCTGSSTAITVTVNPTPTVTVSANYCIGGAKVRLTASSTVASSTYSWSTGATTSFIDVDLAGTYSVTATTPVGCTGTGFINVAQELVTNGTFSAGNTGFTSSYTNNQTFYVTGSPAIPNGLFQEGYYAVNTNANNYHPNFYGTDHTSGTAGTGKFLIVNGFNGTSPIVWQQTVTVTPNTQYYFSAYALSLNQVSPFAQLQFEVNGVQVGTIDTLTAGANSTPSSAPYSWNWTRFYGSWNSGVTTTAVITIVDLQTAAGGNDFGLDDISFGTLSPVPFVISPLGNAGAPLCSGNDLQLTANNTGLAPFTYSWSGPLSFSSTAQNPVISNATTANSGTYTLSVTDGYGCPQTASTTVTVNPIIANNTVTANQTICSGSTPVSLTGSTPTGGSGTYTYLWESSTTSATAGFTTASGTSTGKSYSPSALTQTTWFRRTVTSGGCSDITTTTVQITVNPTIATNTISASQTICSGTTPVALTGSIPTGGNGTYTYLWESSTTSATSGFSTASGTSNGQGYTPGVLTQTTWYRRTVTSGPCSDVATAVQITVNTLPTITSVTGSPTAVCLGSSSNLAVALSGGTSAASTIVNYNFNSGASFGALAPTLATNISSTAAGSATFGTTTGTASGTNAFTSNPTGNALNSAPNNTWTFTLGGSALSSYSSFVVYFQGQRANGGSNTISLSYSLNGAAYTTIGIATVVGTSPNILTLTNATTWYEGEFTIPSAANNPTTSLAFKLTIANSGTGNVQLDNFEVQGTQSNTTYSWTASPSGTAGLPGSASTPSISNSNISVSPTAATTYTVTATNSTGCFTTGNVSLTVNPVPTMSSASSASICSGATVSIPLTSDIGTAYKWIAADNTNTTGESTTNQTSGTLSNTITNTSTSNQNVIYTVTPSVTATGCSGTPQTVTVTVYAPIVNKSVSPGTITICNGTSTNITINNTDVGYNYQLRTGTTVIGTVAGDGNSKTISTGTLTSTTTFNVLAVNATTNCSQQMTTTPVVTVAPLPVDITPVAQATPICQGSSTNIQIASSQSGVSYQLKNNATNANVGSAVAGTGGTINLPTGNLSATTTFNVLATTGTPCSAQMVNTVTVTVTSPITNNNITLASLCQTSSTSAQVIITQDATTLGGGNGTFTYSWLFSSPGNSSYSTILGQTASSLNISQTANNGFYERIVTSGGCSSTSGNVHVNISNVLTASNFTMTGGGSYCSGGSGVAVGLNGSVGSQPEYYVTYQLFLNGVYTGNSVVGTGSAISFGNQTSIGTYTVQSIVTATTGSSCSAVAIPGNVTVSINPLPNVSNQSSTICSGTAFSITPTGQPSGTIYTWVTPSGSGFTGGSAQSTGQTSISQTLSNTTTSIATASYTILPTSGAGCAGSNFTITVTVNPSITIASALQASPVCSGSSAQINLTGLLPNSTSTINYSINGVAQTPVSGLIADGSGNASFNTTALSSANNGQILQITGITNGSCSQSFTQNITLAVNASGTWLGVNTNWFDNQNWCGGVPTITTDVLIPSGLSYYPYLTAGTGTVQNITVQSGASIIINNGTLQIAAAINNSGTFDATSGTIELVGSSPQTIAGSIFAAKTINNLTISNTSTGCVSIAATPNDTLKIAGALSFGNVNNASLKTNDNLTLLSTIVNTARIADVTNNGINFGNTITGKASIERFIPSRRSWRLLTAPISSNQTINAAWQEGVFNTNRTTPSNPTPGYGTDITNTTTAANGYDQGSTNNPSLESYNGSSWVPLAGTNTGSITDLPGYMLFVRGDRSIVVAGINVPSVNTTLRTKGTLNIGAQSVSRSGGFQIVGNPYASSINFYTITRTDSIIDRYITWDSKSTGVNGVGDFVELDGNGDGTYTAVPDPSLSAYDPHPIDKDGSIQSGEAFVIPFIGAGSVTIKETDKIAANDTYAYRPANNTNQTIALFRTNLYSKNSDGSISLEDGVLNEYNDKFDNNVDLIKDAAKFGNIAENIFILRDNTRLAIEKRHTIVADDTIYLRLGQVQLKPYQLEFIPTNLDNTGLQAFLEDNYTKLRTPISLSGRTMFDFSFDANIKESYAGDRFHVVFKPLSVVPVTYTSVKAQQQNADIAVQWDVTNQLNISGYEVEKSTDGYNFTTVYTTASTGNSAPTSIYNWIDSNARAGNNFYRIKAISFNGQIQNSNVVKVTIGTDKPSLVVYPNPIQNGVIGLQMHNMASGKYNLRLLTTLGQTIFIKAINHASGNTIENIPLNQNLAKGSYHLEVTGPDNSKTTLEIVN